MTYVKKYSTYGLLDENINKELAKGAKIINVYPITIEYVGKEEGPGILVVFEKAEQ